MILIEPKKQSAHKSSSNIIIRALETPIEYPQKKAKLNSPYKSYEKPSNFKLAYNSEEISSSILDCKSSYDYNSEELNSSFLDYSLNYKFQEPAKDETRILVQDPAPLTVSNSYKDILDDCIVYCSYLLEGRDEIIELCKALGAIYIEEYNEIVQYIVSNELDQALIAQGNLDGKAVVLSKWLYDCAVSRCKVDATTYLIN